jgi:5-methylthioadenosine/S-adenosylhomocysteine deaminase
METIICNGQLLLFEEDAWRAVRGDLHIEDGVIKNIIRGTSDLHEQFPDAIYVDATNQLVIPGFVNAHYHSHDNLFRGMSSPLPLELWSLRYTHLRQNMTVEDVYINTLLGCAELLASGCVAVTDHVRFFPHLDEQCLKAVFSAYQQAGIRACVTPVIADRPASEALPLSEAERHQFQQDFSDQVIMPAEEQLSRIETLLKEVGQGEDRKLKVGVGPSGPQRCTDQLLDGAADLAARYQTILHMHVLETTLQRSLGEKMYGCSMIRHLNQLGILNPYTQLVHMVRADEKELEMVSEQGSGVVYNPVSNVYLGSGTAPVPEMLRMGIPVSLGTDSICGNGSNNMFETLKWAGILQNLQHVDYTKWISASDVFRMATGGGQCQTNSSSCGEIERGAKADLVLLDYSGSVLSPLNSPLEQVVYCSGGEFVKKVIIDGHIIFNEDPLGFDIEEVYREAAERSRFLSSQNTDHMPQQAIEAVQQTYSRIVEST